ncbi:unnamed protein product [Haemonchus placei]|uniref:Tyrosine-protein kinase n=1 Tax=Haemonchus placei TaxID=6290 RepID=A0A0N4WQD2_HAEPC|nr:unnamed protein product [Haemonchus placei]
MYARTNKKGQGEPADQRVKQSSNLIGKDRPPVKAQSLIQKSKNASNVQPLERKSMSAEKEVDRYLMRYHWFHGMMPREDCEEMVMQEGDYLVRRTTLAQMPTYCITVRHNNEVKHIPISYAKGIWCINKVHRCTFVGIFPAKWKFQECKVTLAELLDVYVKEQRPIAPSNSVLVREIHRPDYFVLHKDITLGQKLGHGAFGEVYCGKLKLKSGEEVDVAIKRAKEGKLKKNQLTSFVREARIMRGLNHPNIVRMYGVAAQEEPVMILLELAIGGSLKAFYKKHEEVSTDQKMMFAKDACRGMCYLFLEKIIHRDLAARNCLLGSKNEVKISDFGLSVADRRELRLNKLHKVPIKWLAPETINEGIFTTKTDVWSYGVLLWEIFDNCKRDPFPGVTNAEAVAVITGKTPPMEPPSGAPPIVKQVMDLCFVKVRTLFEGLPQ